jgi:hypothetical protein
MAAVRPFYRQLNSFIRISNRKNVWTKRVVSNCACEIYRAMIRKYQVTSSFAKNNIFAV